MAATFVFHLVRFVWVVLSLRAGRRKALDVGDDIAELRIAESIGPEEWAKSTVLKAVCIGIYTR